MATMAVAGSLAAAAVYGVIRMRRASLRKNSPRDDDRLAAMATHDTSAAKPEPPAASNAPPTAIYRANDGAAVNRALRALDTGSAASSPALVAAVRARLDALRDVCCTHAALSEEYAAEAAAKIAAIFKPAPLASVYARLLAARRGGGGGSSGANELADTCVKLRALNALASSNAALTTELAWTPPPPPPAGSIKPAPLATECAGAGSPGSPVSVTTPIKSAVVAANNKTKSFK